MTDKPILSPDLLSEGANAAPGPKRRRASVRKRDSDCAVVAVEMPGLLLAPVAIPDPDFSLTQRATLQAVHDELLAIKSALNQVQARLIVRQN